MGLRLGKRLTRLCLLLIAVLGLSGVVLYATGHEMTTYYVDSTKDLVDSYKDWWNTEEKHAEEDQSLQADPETDLKGYADGTTLADSEEVQQEEQGITGVIEDNKNGNVVNATVKAAFVSLVRNEDLAEIVKTVTNLEERFNGKFHYPYVFLNNEPFSDPFKEAIREVVSSDVKFGLIPREHWSFPEWIDQERAAEVRATADYIYGDSESYRHMCRYESGFFWRHELMEKYDYYWRVEPSTKLHCDVNYDVFQWMQDNNKVYGFTVSIKEFESTIKTLWKTTMNFTKEYPEYLAENNMLDYISNDHGETYNLCHFWSNFEVASLNFWRSEAYRKYFEHLDKAGGFFYERWGDAPVHSIAAALFLPSEQVHYFPEIGYFHHPFNNCPLDQDIWHKNKCTCSRMLDFSFQGYSCTKEYYDFKKMKKPDGWEMFRS
ncbi:LADA_0F01772g1_1 [Lachancea dasiensis]|uniref:LADA_0F01772g1_1 n=1 Tax=Lachancea dasiensis TaxID=1072105 RepID=A0A1G4JI65_9SACH|nr:LADA_0F01772g1_1 [Lachancea dasiensis]